MTSAYRDHKLLPFDDAVVIVIRYWMGESRAMLAVEHHLTGTYVGQLINGVARPNVLRTARLHWLRHRETIPPNRRADRWNRNAVFVRNVK